MEFIRNNLVASIAFAFLFIAGLASGVTTVQILYGETAPALVRAAPTALMDVGVGYSLSIALLVEGATVCTGLLCLLWAPAAVLWPFILLIRGFLLGVGLFASVCALPEWPAVALLLLLQLNAAIALPCLLALFAGPGQALAMRFKAFATGAKVRGPQPPSSLRAMAAPVLGLAACGLIEGAVFPTILRLLAS